MAKRMLEATGPMRYGTRMLQAGDEFEAPGPRARALIGLGRAREAQARRQSRATPPPQREPEPEPEGITATDLRRMRKAELASYLQDAGHEVDDEMTRDELLERALAHQGESAE